VNSLDHILDERAARDERSRRLIAAGIAVFVHLVVIGGAFLGPRLFAEPVKPTEFLPVTLLPPPAKGVPNPRREPPKPEPVREEPAEPAPEPEPAPVPEPSPVPPPTKAPPAEAPKPEPKPTPTPAPAPTKPPTTPTPATPSQQPGGTVAGREGVATGRVDSSFTEGAAVAGLDNPDFRYAYYVDRMAAMIRRQWTRPPVGAGIEVAIHFIVDRDGRVREVEVVRASGSAAFDLAGRRAVESAAPLPPLPKGYAGDTLGVTLIFR
jgi:TonB family protein